MHLAKELGYTLGELTMRITPAEYSMWLAFYQLEAERQQEAERKSKRR